MIKRIIILWGLMLTCLSVHGQSTTKETDKKTYVDLLTIHKYNTAELFLNYNLKGNVSKIEDKSYRLGKILNDSDGILDDDFQDYIVAEFDKDNKLLTRHEAHSVTKLTYDTNGRPAEMQWENNDEFSNDKGYIIRFYHAGNKLSHRDVYKNHASVWSLFCTDTFIYVGNQLEKIVTTPMLPIEKYELNISYDKDGHAVSSNNNSVETKYNKNGGIAEKRTTRYGIEEASSFTYNEFNDVVTISRRGANPITLPASNPKLSTKSFIDDFIKNCESMEEEKKANVTFFAYKYDHQGNWIVRVRYEDGNTTVTERTVTYSKR